MCFHLKGLRENGGTAYKRRCGFTLVELLVVIGIIALLVSILLPALNKARNSAIRVQCASNLRQLGQYWHIYANDHKGFFPNTGISYGSLYYMLWDQRQIFVEQYGFSDSVGGGRIFYCPESYYPASYYWTYRAHAAPADVMIAGYFFWNAQGDRPPGDVYSSVTMQWNASEGYNLPPLKKNSDRRATEIPMVFDWTLQYGPLDWTASSHKEGDAVPAGGNVLYGDGHVSWKQLKSMIKVVSGYPTYVPYF